MSRKHKKNGHAVYATLGLTLAMILFFGCVPKGEVYRVKPPKVGWEGIRDIAVLAFDGPYGESLRRRVCHRLADVQYFNPKDTSQALARISLDKPGSPESLQALAALGADAVMTGVVTVEIHDTHGADQVEVKEGTGYYKKGKDASGRWIDVEIKRAVIRPVPYVMREARLWSEFKVVDVAGHVVIAAGKVTEKGYEKFGGDMEYASLGRRLSDLPTSSGTAEELSGRAAIKLVAELSRMKLGRVLKLDPGANPLVKRGVTLAKAGDWEQAMDIWEQVLRDKPDEAAAYYNLGVACEGLGDMESLKTARDLYKKAASHGADRLYTDGILRVDRVISDSDTD
jgi:tetratricopeptide (TPR) repeat protein